MKKGRTKFGPLFASPKHPNLLESDVFARLLRLGSGPTITAFNAFFVGRRSKFSAQAHPVIEVRNRNEQRKRSNGISS